MKRTRRRASLSRLVLSAGACLVVALPAQDERGLAIVNARVLPISGPAIERGTVLVRAGKIEQVGSGVAVPPGYSTVDAAGGTLMPGAVSAHTHTGLAPTQQTREERPNQFRRGGRGRRGRGTPGPVGDAENKSGERVLDQLYAQQEVFAELLRDGVTTLGIAPLGRGLPGQGAVVRPRGADVAAMTVVASAFVTIAPVADAKTKDMLKSALDSGRRALERRKRRADAKAEEAKGEAEKKAEAGKEAGEKKPAEPDAKPTGDKPPAPEKPADQPGEGKPVDARPTEGRTTEGRPADGSPPARPQSPPDPGAEAMADLLEGKTRALVQIDSAMDFVHWADVKKDATFPLVLVARRHATAASTQGSLELVLDKLRPSKGIVLLSPEFATLPNTEYQVNLAARLHAAGLEVGFLLPERGRALSTVRTQLMELVRAGLPVDVALRGITLTPAKALGVDKQLGSIDKGMAANLVLWTADPLDPTARLARVWLDGQEVEDDAR